MAASDHEDDTPTGEFKGTRNGDEHIDNCKDWYTPSNTFYKRSTAPNAKFWNSHHLVIVASVADAHIEVSKKQLEYIKKCLNKTSWNINATPNLVGLDTKWIYVINAKDDTNYPDSLLPNNYPSHRIDHPRYNKAVFTYMHQNIWNEILGQQADHPDGKSIQSELESASTHFKTELKARGDLHGGTRQCWKDRNKKALKNTWYEPFSMAIAGDPMPRHPIPSKSKLKRYDQLFNAIE